MKKSYFIIAGVVAILFLAVLFSSKAGLFSVYVQSEGSQYNCGIHNEGYDLNQADLLGACESEGYYCTESQRSGYLGTIYEMDCVRHCNECGDNGFTMLFKTNEANGDTCGDNYQGIVGESLTSSEMKQVSGSYHYSPDFDKADLLCGGSTTDPDVDVVCWKCDGASINSETHTNSCESEWTEDWQNLQCEAEVDPVICYACNGDSVNSKVFEDKCDTGWTENRPTCASNEVTCYSCINDQVSTQSYDNSCPSGWDISLPVGCGVQPNTCYACDGIETITKDMTVCENGWYDEEQTCDEDPIQCFKCTNEEQTYTDYYEETCPEGTNEEPISNCGKQAWIKKYFDLEEKPTQSILIIVAIASIVMMLFALLIKPPGNGGEGIL